jgi:hypothetical protein
VLTRLGPVDRAAVTAHYGSTSLVTFTAAVALLEAQDEPYEAYAATLLAVLEVPGILVGLLLAGGAAAAAGRAGRGDPRGAHRTQHPAAHRGPRDRRARRSPAAYDSVAPLFVVLFPGALVLFLLDLGVLAGRRLRDVPSAAAGLVVAAIAIPLVNGSLGVLVGTAIGPDAGGAPPAGRAHRQRVLHRGPPRSGLALPQANPAYYLTTSLGITFPFNLVIGIPLYLALARALG